MTTSLLCADASIQEGARRCNSAGAESARPSSFVRMVLLIGVFSIPAATVLRPLDEFDTWQHLSTGEWIAQHRAVPTTDLYATVLEGKSWIAYSWLFELLLHHLHHHLGLGGVVVYRLVMSLLVTAVVYGFICRREPRLVVAVGLTAATLAAFSPLLCERPWLFSILFCTLTLDAVLDLREGRTRWTIWLLPLVYVLWANLHIQFIYGLLILGLAVVGPIIDRWRDRGRLDAGGDWRLVGLTAACLLATLVNPYGWHLWMHTLELGGQGSFYHLVGEMRSLSFRSPWDWAVLGLGAAAVFSLGRRPRVHAFEVLLLASSAYFSFQCRRDLWLLVLASLAVLLAAPRSSVAAVDHTRLSTRQGLIVGLGVSAVLLIFCWRRDCSETQLAAETAVEFPSRAAAFVEQQGYAGPLYNHADWGSYLLWRLPHLPIAIDGRFHLYGDERAFRFQRTADGRQGWESDPDLSSAVVVIVRSQIPLASLLREDPRFELVHEDPVAVVFIARASPRSAPNLAVSHQP